MGKIRAMSLFYKSIDNQLNKINKEHMTVNQRVAGSSPAGGALKIKHLRQPFWGCDSSIGTNGYVTYNLNCGYDEKDEIKIDYSLPRQSYPDPKILDNVCQQRI